MLKCVEACIKHIDETFQCISIHQVYSLPVPVLVIVKSTFSHCQVGAVFFFFITFSFVHLNVERYTVSNRKVAGGFPPAVPQSGAVGFKEFIKACKKDFATKNRQNLLFCAHDIHHGHLEIRLLI